MFNLMRRLFSILKVVNADTHLWCVSVLAGAILLCVSFFVEPSSRQFVAAKDDAQSVAPQKVIEYSSVLGSLSSIDTLEEEEVDKIAEAMPMSFDEHFEGEDEDILPAESKEVAEEGSETEPEVLKTDIPAAVAPAEVPDIDLGTVYSPETLDVLERLVQCEAATEDMDGRMLVANVVLNRVDTGIWGDDVLSVIMSEGQFDPIGNGAYKVCEVDSVTKKAVINALLGEDISQGAIYFQKSNARVWGNKTFLFRHGSHSFYK